MTRRHWNGTATNKIELRNLESTLSLAPLSEGQEAIRPQYATGAGWAFPIPPLWVPPEIPITEVLPPPIPVPPIEIVSGAYLEIWTAAYPYWSTEGEPRLAELIPDEMSGGRLRGPFVKTGDNTWAVTLLSDVMEAPYDPENPDADNDGNIDGWPDNPAGWEGSGVPAADEKWGPFYPLSRAAGAAGSAVFTLTYEEIEIDGEFVQSPVLSYELSLTGLDILEFVVEGAIDTVDAILINVVTKTYGGVEVGDNGRIGRWVFGIIGPSYRDSEGNIVPLQDQIDITVIDDTALITGEWTYSDWSGGEGSGVAAKDLNDWLEYL